MGNELLAKYRAGIDNKLYKAIVSSQKAAGMAYKGMIPLEAEAV